MHNDIDTDKKNNEKSVATQQKSLNMCKDSSQDIGHSFCLGSEDKSYTNYLQFGWKEFGSENYDDRIRQMCISHSSTRFFRQEMC